MIVLSFDQPHATLIANRIQTVATYPYDYLIQWPDREASRLSSLVGQMVAIAATGAGAFARSPDPNTTWPVPVGDLPRSAIVGSAPVKAVERIVRASEWDEKPAIVLTEKRPPHFKSTAPFPEVVYFHDVMEVGTSLDDQLPFADFSPGRIAVIFEDAASCEERCPACGGRRYRTCYCWGKDGCAPIPYESTGPISEVTL